MSGGSYEYLYSKDVEDLLYMQETIQKMADRLAGLGYASDAAKETQELLLTLRQFENRISAIKERLSDVWHSVELLDNRDSGEDSVKNALEKYRAVFA
jgi:hypothetical protein